MVTPSLLCASGAWAMTEEMKEKLQTTQRRMMRMITQTKNNSAAAHSVNVDEAVDDEPRDTESVSEEGTSEANPQDPLEKDESNQDADSKSIFRQVPLGHSEHELEPWDYKRCARKPRRRRLVGSSWILSWILGQSWMSWKQAGMIAEHHDGRWTKTDLENTATPAKQKGYQRRGSAAKRWKDDHNLYIQPTKIQRQQRSHERHDLKIPCLLQTRSSTVSTPQHHESLNLSGVLILVCAHSTASNSQTSSFCCLVKLI